MPQYQFGRPFDVVRSLKSAQRAIAQLQNNRALPLLQGTPMTGMTVVSDTSLPDSAHYVYSAALTGILNQNGDFETTVLPWTGYGGAATGQASAGALHGTSALQMTVDSAAVSPGVQSEVFVVTPSVSHTTSMWLYSVQGYATVQFGFFWYDINGNFISSSLITSFALAAGIGQLKTFTATSPVNAATGRIVAQLTGSPASTVQLSIDVAWAIAGTIPVSQMLISSHSSQSGYDQYGNVISAGMTALTGNIWGGVIAPASISASQVNFTAANIGGITVSFSNTAPGSPVTGQLWYDGSNGNELKQWNGSAWVAYQYGTNAIQANSVTAALIAANTITAAQLAAGIIYAGIVDATTIQAPTIIGSVILGYAAVPRGPTLWGFETGIQAWSASGTHGTVAQSAVWSSTGNNSLALTADGTGSPIAYAPTGTSGIPVVPNDPVSLAIDLFSTTGLTNCFVGLKWFDSLGASISETDCPDTTIVANVQTTLTVSDVAPATAAYVNAKFGAHITPAAGTILYGDNAVLSGNLAFTASPDGGTDSLGNIFEQGIVINGIAGLTSGFTVQDAWGANTLASIDASGNISGQTISATQDIILAGSSLLNTLNPAQPLGCIARTNVFSSSLPAPVTPTTTEFRIYGLSVAVVNGRAYSLEIESMRVVLGGAGKVRVNVYGTADGTAPTTASPVICQSEADYPGGTTNFGVTTPAIHHYFQPSASATWQFLVTLSTLSTGSGQPTLQLTTLESAPTGEGTGENVNCRFEVYDQGLSIPNTGNVLLNTTGSGGGGTQNYTKTYTATHSYAYQGSDAGSNKINTDGRMYQGGNVGNTFNGMSKTWILFNHSAIQTDLTGASAINWVKVYLNNNHTWYNSGMSVRVAWSGRTTFGSTAADPTGDGQGSAAEQHFNEGQAQWFDVSGAGIGTNFQNGLASSLVLFKSTNGLLYYGYFSGASSSSPPKLQINYTK